MGRQGKFEQAIELRNKIEKTNRVFENAKIINNTQIEMATLKELVELKKSLKLKKLPHRIEGYDISNIQGTHATGSMVVFLGGKPNKSEYRKFTIYTKQSPDLPNRQADDTAVLKEILIRRLKHLEWPTPELMLVDGGKAQLNAMLSVLSASHPPLTTFVIALTKDERHKGNKIYVSGKKDPVPLSRLPKSVKNLLIRIDSEAHRFTISYYRKVHRRSIETNSKK